ncbi:hypothetical protein OIE66_04235 [Nonomuraea sp. NBC_01738]|uniref:hypothetical protein n=1 Tax=Nonomuraea sp. NBC_01738 TaxID=2976003 RepID=UPI002E0EA946|nr:hypothetical protein OIE66_04235 [Nonomuraea sp. NBC_01738]
MITRFPTATYAALIVVSVTASILLAAPGADAGRSLWTDPQSLSQILGSWRMSAAFAYTAGSTVGYVCAIIAGRLAVRPLVAYLAGAVLGLVQLAASWVTSSATMAADLASWTSEEAVRPDPGILHHPSVLAAMVLVFLTLPIAARLGFGTTGNRPTGDAMLVISSLALIALVHFVVPALPLLVGVSP